MSTDKTRAILITGGNRGIGLAVVKSFAALEGYRVLMGCRDPGTVEPDSVSGNVTPVSLNLDDGKRLQRNLDRILERHGRIEVLVNNAGVLEYGDLLNMDETTLDRHMQVNFRAPWLLTRRLMPAMIEAGMVARLPPAPCTPIRDSPGTSAALASTPILAPRSPVEHQNLRTIFHMQMSMNEMLC